MNKVWTKRELQYLLAGINVPFFLQSDSYVSLFTNRGSEVKYNIKNMGFKGLVDPEIKFSHCLLTLKWLQTFNVILGKFQNDSSD